MEERAIDEFESIFESAVRPRVEITPIEWSSLLVALDGTERSTTGVAIALHLAERFRLKPRFLATRALLAGEEAETLQAALDEWVERARGLATDVGVESTGVARIGSPGEVVIEELAAAPTTLLIIPTPHGGQTPDQTTLGSTVDHILKVSDCPALLIKASLQKPEAVFERMLAYMPSGFEVGPHFSIPFALVEPKGSLELCHVVDDEAVRRYAAAFEITADADTEEEKAAQMMRGLEEKMTALLEAAVAEVTAEPFDCRALVEEGNPIQRVALRLLNQRDTLLVVESESRPETAVTPEAYAMIKEITGVPILAL